MAAVDDVAVDFTVPLGAVGAALLAAGVTAGAVFVATVFGAVGDFCATVVVGFVSGFVATVVL